ncbi:MAG: MarR family winged helix-turn-helix transcriptional regulator [Xanthobacteraceae bacterium]|jgi:DNA-binding MarR family transcriptional regulator
MGTSSAVERNRCNCAVLRKASRRLSQLYDSALAPSGLKSTQFAICAEIDRRAGEPPTLRDLAEALVMDQSTVGQNLRPLERDGLISLEQDATDRRRRHVKLTRKGRSRFAAAQPLWDRAQARFEDSFGKQQAADLRAVLVQIARIRSLSRDGAAPSP